MPVTIGRPRRSNVTSPNAPRMKVTFGRLGQRHLQEQVDMRARTAALSEQDDRTRRAARLRQAGVASGARRSVHGSACSSWAASKSSTSSRSGPLASWTASGSPSSV